ncbi:hypothetical protein OHS58_05820 [Amycolatopsis sp. NBC_00348]
MSQAEEVAEILARIGPVDGSALLSEAQRRWPSLTLRRLRTIVMSAIQAGLVLADGEILSAVAEVAQPDDGRCDLSRAVIVDFESVVRPSSEKPDGDRQVYQIGAARLSGDSDWVGKGERFIAWVRLSDEDWEAEIRSERVRASYESHAVSPVEAFEALRQFCADADTLIAYNGIQADFPLLDEASGNAGIQGFGGHRRVDALYLAHAIWPTASSHRLAELATEVGVDRTGLRWHDAEADAILTARVVQLAALAVAAWPEAERVLALSAGTGSAAWDLLASLLPSDLATREHDDAEVEQVLSDLIPAPSPSHRNNPLVVPDELRDDSGRVDPHRLAQAAASGRVERRPAQQEMSAQLAAQVTAGRDALCEAPTGTGKSLAVLATGLDWLAGAPGRQVVLSTHTKQLQTQFGRSGDAQAVRDELSAYATRCRGGEVLQLCVPDLRGKEFVVQCGRAQQDGVPVMRIPVDLPDLAGQDLQVDVVGLTGPAQNRVRVLGCLQKVRHNARRPLVGVNGVSQVHVLETGFARREVLDMAGALRLPVKPHHQLVLGRCHLEITEIPAELSDIERSRPRFPARDGGWIEPQFDGQLTEADSPVVAKLSQPAPDYVEAREVGRSVGHAGRRSVRWRRRGVGAMPESVSAAWDWSRSSNSSTLSATWRCSSAVAVPSRN